MKEVLYWLASMKTKFDEFFWIFFGEVKFEFSTRQSERNSGLLFSLNVNKASRIFRGSKIRTFNDKNLVKMK